MLHLIHTTQYQNTVHKLPRSPQSPASKKHQEVGYKSSLHSTVSDASNKN